MKKVESVEYQLSQSQCAEVALYMHEEYKKAMQAPVYSVISFEDWLKKLIPKH